MFYTRITFLFYMLFFVNCSHNQKTPENPEQLFALAKQPYESGNYEIALNKLGEFKARFPYSKFSAESELLIADAHFHLSQFAESAATYEQFIKLHPNHPKSDFAQFRVGESYWAEAPEEANREQELTAKAIDEWTVLTENNPSSEFAKKAADYIKKGHRRMAESNVFIANFYCKQEIWHACAYRHVTLAEQAVSEFPDLAKKSFQKASLAFEKMSEKWNEDKQDNNIYFKNMSSSELKNKASQMIKKANEITS